jgi:hypothetical protein
MPSFLRIIGNAMIIAACGIVIWTGYTLMQPRPEPEKKTVIQVGPAILEQIKHVNQQIFVKHYISVDVTYEETPASWFDLYNKIGIKQNFVMLIRGNVPAGFDLSELTEKDIWVSKDGRRVQVTLPAPYIMEDALQIDTEHSRLLAKTDLCPNFLCTTDIEAYQTIIEPEARKKLIAAAQEAGILKQAAEDGRAFYQKLLNGLGFAEVRVVVRGYDL